MHTPRRAKRADESGFSLVEALIALLVLSFGLLSVAQMLAVAVGGPTLARSKSSATLVAQDRLESLGEEYIQNPEGANLTVGAHGPAVVEVRNPVTNTVLNRYSVTWNVTQVPDPRAWKTLHAKIVSATVTPLGVGEASNNKMLLNKVVTVSTTFSAR